MLQGYALCVDSLLDVFAILPLRLSIFVLALLSSPRNPSHAVAAYSKDFFLFISMSVAAVLLCRLDPSILYHDIRGQCT